MPLSCKLNIHILNTHTHTIVLISGNIYTHMYSELHSSFPFIIIISSSCRSISSSIIIIIMTYSILSIDQSLDVFVPLIVTCGEVDTIIFMIEIEILRFCIK